jgi:hypothetical protein
MDRPRDRALLLGKVARLMTTIATDGKTIAADRMVSGGHLVHSTTFIKVKHLNDGRVFASAGSPYDVETWLKFLNGEICEISLSDQSEALTLDHKGVVRFYDHNGRSYVQEAPAVLGSGEEVALGAMLAGASPRKAVEIAMKIDTNSGGAVDELAPIKPKSVKSLKRTECKNGLLREALVKIEDVRGQVAPNNYGCNLTKRIEGELAQRETWQTCHKGSCQRHGDCMYLPCLAAPHSQ